MKEKLRFGVISTARIGVSQFIPAVQSSSELCVVSAIASRDLTQAQRVAAQLNLPKAYGTYDELLSDPDIDAVYISLPNRLHAIWARRAAEAGKHVLCEKPLARTVSAAREVAESCAQRDIILMEAFMYRHHPQHTKVKELLAAGAIGEIHIIRASFCFTLRNPDSNIRMNAELEGGALMDVGCYAVNASRFLFEAEPIAASAFEHRDPVYGVDVSLGGILLFSEGRLGIVDCSLETGSGGRYEVAGSEGMIIADRAFTPGTNPVTIRLIRGNNVETFEIPATNQYALEADHFARSVAEGKLLQPAEDGVANTYIIEALYQAAAQGTIVHCG
ncbi:MAG: Gfo/Idh/MocA family oxidoreductase [Chloroflexi bacterium]|nr:Gfo/Idh/MocA family oxidoreductase [Chloroflexota bacterium]